MRKNKHISKKQLLEAYDFMRRYQLDLYHYNDEDEFIERIDELLSYEEDHMFSGHDKDHTVPLYNDFVLRTYAHCKKESFEQLKKVILPTGYNDAKGIVSKYKRLSETWGLYYENDSWEYNSLEEFLYDFNTATKVFSEFCFPKTPSFSFELITGWDELDDYNTPRKYKAKVIQRPFIDFYNRYYSRRKPTQEELAEFIGIKTTRLSEILMREKKKGKKRVSAAHLFGFCLFFKLSIEEAIELFNECENVKPLPAYGYPAIILTHFLMEKIYDYELFIALTFGAWYHFNVEFEETFTRGCLWKDARKTIDDLYSKRRNAIVSPEDIYTAIYDAKSK